MLDLHLCQHVSPVILFRSLLLFRNQDVTFSLDFISIFLMKICFIVFFFHPGPRSWLTILTPIDVFASLLKLFRIYPQFSRFFSSFSRSIARSKKKNIVFVFSQFFTLYFIYDWYTVGITRIRILADISTSRMENKNIFQNPSLRIRHKNHAF